MALPMAAFLDVTWEKIWSRSISAGLALAFIVLNIFQSIQYSDGMLHWDSMSKAFYWTMFGKRQFLPEAEKEKLLQHPDNDKALEYGHE
jgi:hypothetical protein